MAGNAKMTPTVRMTLFDMAVNPDSRSTQISRIERWALPRRAAIRRRYAARETFLAPRICPLVARQMNQQWRTRMKAGPPEGDTWVCTTLSILAKTTEPCGRDSICPVRRLLPYAAAFTLSEKYGEYIPFDVSGGGFTITLPASPYDGMTFHFSEVKGSSNALTVTGTARTSTERLLCRWRSRTSSENPVLIRNGRRSVDRDRGHLWPQSSSTDCLAKMSLEGTSAAEFVAQLPTDGSPIEVRINSEGGSVVEGFAMANALYSYKGETTAIIEGQAKQRGKLRSCVMQQNPHVRGELHGSHMGHGAPGRQCRLSPPDCRRPRPHGGLMRALYRRRGISDEQIDEWFAGGDHVLTPEDAQKVGSVRRDHQRTGQD